MGHEIDFTICDFIADLRAPTPSAGAELVSQNAKNLSEQVEKMRELIYQNIKRELFRLKEKLNVLNNTLIHPGKKIQELQQYMDELNANLRREIFQQTKLKREKFKALFSLLQSLSPLKVLSRGYCLINKDKALIKSAQSLKKGDKVCIRFSESFALAHINKTGFLPKTDKKPGP